MHLTVIGASRGIGREVMDYALERGHSVRAVARSADKIERMDEALERCAGDATDAAFLIGALAGTDAVIMTLGVPRDLRALKRTALFSDATAALLPAMQSAGLRRLLVVTGFGAGESEASLSFLERAGMKAFLGRAYADKSRQEDMIRQSGLDWTIARPGILTNGKRTGRYKTLIAPETWRQGMISRANVAHFLVHAAEEGSHIRETPALQH